MPRPSRAWSTACKLRGFVTTQADPDDRRRRAVTLTEAGPRRDQSRPPSSRAEITAETLAPLTAEEQRTIVRLLKKLT